MKNQMKLTHAQIFPLINNLAAQISQTHNPTRRKFYAIPRGGIPVGYLLMSVLQGAHIVDDPEQADFFVDDIIDSGETLRRYCDEYPGKAFFALVDKGGRNTFTGKWIVFPWESANEEDDHSVTDNVVRMLQFIGENPEREGLRETPQRVVKAWKTWFGGYDQDVKDVMKVFEDGAEGCDEMVIVRDIDVYSHCEHHIAPIFGKCTIAYIPNGKVLGLSKFNRLVDIFARRLQVQERLTTQIADAIEHYLQPKGVFVQITARHLCVESRGVKQNSTTTTNAIHGVFKTDAAARAEFLNAAK